MRSEPVRNFAGSSVGLDDSAPSEWPAVGRRRRQARVSRCEAHELDLSLGEIAHDVGRANFLGIGHEQLLPLTAGAIGSGQIHDKPESWDLVPTFDIWGIPISPRPKMS